MFDIVVNVVVQVQDEERTRCGAERVYIPIARLLADHCCGQLKPELGQTEPASPDSRSGSVSPHSESRAVLGQLTE